MEECKEHNKKIDYIFSNSEYVCCKYPDIVRITYLATTDGKTFINTYIMKCKNCNKEWTTPTNF